MDSGLRIAIVDENPVRAAILAEYVGPASAADRSANG